MTSLMHREAHEAPTAVARLLASDCERVAALGAALRATPPRALLTLARGSSDHAAHYTAYLVMARLGRLVTSLPMSLVTLYRARLDCDGLVSLAFSQSGVSPDLVEPTREFAARGANTVAFVNDTASPLAAAARWVFALQAGPEASVAATKSCVAQIAAGARFVAAWQGDAGLRAALDALPAVQRRAGAGPTLGRRRAAAADARRPPARDRSRHRPGAGDGSGAGTQLPLAPTADIDLDPIAALACLYPMVEAPRARGRDT